MPETSLYEQVLARLGSGERLVPPAKVRASASVVLWRRAEPGEVEVFWVRRSDKLRFMGGWHAFPGGGLSRRDAAIEISGVPAGLDQGPADAALPGLVLDGVQWAPVLVPGLVGCLVRELLEETGVVPAAELLAGEPQAGLGERLAAARRRLLGKRQDLSRLAAELELGLDASLLVFAGRWLTPPLGPVRFDNRFFLLEWPAGAGIQPRVEPGELASGEWVRPAAAVARWERAEALVAPPILYILRVLAEGEPTERGLARLRDPADANLGEFRRVEFRPGVLLFPLATPTLPPAAYTNAYLLGFDNAALIDPGSPWEREGEALAGALQAAAAEGRRATAIWLTHHHPDHVGGVERLRAALGLPVLAHPLTAERLAAGGIRVDGTLEDAQRVELGGGGRPFPVRVLHTPGHARGHLCFFDETHGSLLAGDVVAGLGTIVIDPPEGEMETYLATLARLRDLAPRTLFPAHGPAILQARARLQHYLDHRLWREERVLAAWRAGERQPAEMLPLVYPDLEPLARPLAERQIVAHLERLRALGRIRPQTRDPR